MKERPILFSAPMVAAILASRKTQTRRLVKPTPYQRYAKDAWYWTSRNMVYGLPHQDDIIPSALAIYNACPYGRVGDRLWVRETWRTDEAFDDAPPRSIVAGAGVTYHAGGTNDPSSPITLYHLGKTRPAIFMPRWASRLTLEICSVRVERLQKISAEDAEAEGIDRMNCYGPGCPDGPNGCNAKGCFGLREAYQQLWEKINGAGSWDANAWVWVVEFRRVSDETESNPDNPVNPVQSSERAAP